MDDPRESLAPPWVFASPLIWNPEEGEIILAGAPAAKCQGLQSLSLPFRDFLDDWPRPRVSPRPRCARPWLHPGLANFSLSGIGKVAAFGVKGGVDRERPHLAGLCCVRVPVLAGEQIRTPEARKMGAPVGGGALGWRIRSIQGQEGSSQILLRSHQAAQPILLHPNNFRTPDPQEFV